MIPLDLERALQAGDEFGHDARQFWAGFEILRGASAALGELGPGQEEAARREARQMAARADSLCRDALQSQPDPRLRMIAGAILRGLVMAYHAVYVPPPAEFQRGSSEDRRSDEARLPELAALFE